MGEGGGEIFATDDQEHRTLSEENLLKGELT